MRAGERPLRVGSSSSADRTADVQPSSGVDKRRGPLIDRIWTPPHFASTPFSGDEVRLLTYIRPLSDLDQPRSGHDGLFARRLLIALSGFTPLDILRLFRRRFDLFAILRGARNRGDVLLDQSERTGSGSHALRFIVRSVAQHRPGDPRHLVGESGCCHVRVRSLGQRKGPAAEPIGLAWRCS